MAGAILAVVLVVAATVVGLLVIPVTFTFRVVWPETAGNELRLTWAFGLVNVRVPTGVGAPPAMTDAGAHARSVGRAAKRRRARTPNLFAALRQKPFRQRVLRLAMDLWRAVDRRNLRLDLRIGTGDPAETGQLWAVVGPISGILQNIEGGRVRIVPEFVDAVFDFDGSGRLRVIPLQVLAIAAGLVFSPPIWRGLRAMRAGG
ncbi:hypothetical protein TVNIR_3689 [Thioalkalivibrio nitratireducens DSM 14787]|uniref:DUF2953 domain-containing protein n=1 Tax=Thioalkalivibrio nitratireducens (strain DSM 14787 / UNIQEM 213 / ALEN2) TaxID=1255043 RepID=L0E241_THIND|nr:DUF2953 domain-containing protein [Thioalkalivibrio nitratireducens]AGA35317.1 hypothetical protein TVNIR_3689 [Thioalkalivibrio nitratireducens DSM 14787]